MSRGSLCRATTRRSSSRNGNNIGKQTAHSLLPVCPKALNSTPSTCSLIPAAMASTSAIPRATRPPTSSAAIAACRGHSVMHPMGWDAFGLPAEQHAKKTGTHPRTTTEKNIANFRRQLKMLGFSYDWDRELATTDVRLLPLDAVHLPGAVRHLVRRRAATGPADRRAAHPRGSCRGRARGGRPISRRASAGLPDRGPGQLVPGPGHGAGQRGGGGRRERARRASGGPPAVAAVDAADHRLCRPAGKRPRRARLAREHQAVAAELDRAKHGGGGRFLHRHVRRRRRPAVAARVSRLADGPRVGRFSRSSRTSR